MGRKILIVANPISGRGSASRLIDKVCKLLEERNFSYEVVMTAEHGETQRRLSGLRSRFKRIVIIGGDGTVNATINALQQPISSPLAVLPAGTANMLAHELNLPSDPAEFVELLDNGMVRYLDVGVAQNRLFMLLLSAGFDAMVTKELSDSRDDILGYRGYLLPILKVLSKYKVPELRVSVDGKPHAGSLALVFHSRNYGGIFSVSQSAELDSGRFEVCILKSGAIPNMLRYSIAALVKRLADLPDVEYTSGSSIRIESDEPVAVEIDGDYFGTTPVSVEVARSAVPVMVTANRNSNRNYWQWPT
jgi:diacylglycerol kinase (ATP)